MITFELPFGGLLFFGKKIKNKMLKSREPNHLLEMTQKQPPGQTDQPTFFLYKRLIGIWVYTGYTRAQLIRLICIKRIQSYQ